MNRTFLLFFRNLRINKSISVINIAGLVLGMLSAMFILEYVSSERSYDKYHEKGETIYRVVYDRYKNKELLYKTTCTFYPTGRWLQENYDEVKDFAVIQRKYNVSVSYTDITNSKVFFFEPKTYYATSSIFNLFTIPLVQGNKECLTEPNTVALSSNVAKRYFGQSDPMGKELIVNNTEHYTVTAIFEPIPGNSHLKTDFLFSISTLTAAQSGILNNWGFDYYNTYIRLNENTNYKEFAQNVFPEMIKEHYERRQNARNLADEYHLQPLTSIHLQSNIEYETETPGNSKGVSILFGFAMFLMLVAWINYVNLSTARSVDRAREIGLKKISGAKQRALFWQFISESVLFNVICFVIALTLFFIINPFFKSLSQITDFNLSDVSELLMFVTAFFLSGILISGIYPALIVASFKPIKVLKGQFKNTSQGIGIRKGLLVIQFTISVVLLIGAFITYKQAKLLIEKDMGVNYNQSIVIRAPRLNISTSDFQQKMDVFRNMLLQLPQVEDYTFTSAVPGQEMEIWFMCHKKGEPPTNATGHFQLAIDDRFMEFYDVQLLAGRAFYNNENAESRNLMLNESSLKRLGYDKPEDIVGKQITRFGEDYTVVGVTKDFHYKSVKVAAVPTVISLNDRFKSYVSVKFHQEGLEQAAIIGDLKKHYQEVFPDQPFEYYSLDEDMRKDLKSDRTFVVIFGFFSILGIIIACIGIIGLMLITANQKMKEMGIRKVLGAQQIDISWFLSKNVVVQFVIALFIAIPLSYYGYQRWFIENYIYRISQEWWYYVLPTIMFSSIIFAVIYFTALRVSKTNLAETMRCE